MYRWEGKCIEAIEQTGKSRPSEGPIDAKHERQDITEGNADELGKVIELVFMGGIHEDYSVHVLRLDGVGYVSCEHATV